MNVLMVAPAHVPHATRPLAWLLRTGCTVTLVDGTNPYPDARDGFRFLPYPGPSGRTTLRKVSRSLADIAVSWRVLRPLRHIWSEIRPDVVHVHWIDERAHDCAMAGLRPLVLTAWGSDINNRFAPDDDPHYRRVVGEALAAADVVIVDSPDMPEKCAQLAGHAVPTALLPLGIDTKHFCALPRSVAVEQRRRLAIPDDAIVFLTPRALRPLYGHHFIIEAFARARRSLPRDAVLVVKAYDRQRVGSAYERELRQQIERLRLTDAVRWMESVPQERLPEVYALADIVLNFPSQDAFPVTFLEAAACERRVVTGRLPAYEGTFAEAYFRMCEQNSPDALADAMIAVASEAAECRSSLLRGAREVVASEYDESASVRQLLALYEGLARPT